MLSADDLRRCVAEYRARCCTSTNTDSFRTESLAVDGEDCTPGAGFSPRDTAAAVTHAKAACFDGAGMMVYCPVSQLGKGGTARVDLVQIKGSDLQAALKSYTVLLEDNQELDEDKARQALVELHVLQACGGGPHIPQLLDAFIDAPNICMVMQVAKGKDLMALLRETNAQTFPEADVKQMALDILDALEHLHSCGITYVDIKPENIVLDAEDKSLTLVDFGLCHVPASSCRDSATAFADLLCADAVQAWMTPPPIPGENPRFWGTLEYVAPEVIDSGAAAFSSLSDFWSFGILLYELLYGKTPFRGQSTEQTFYNIRMRGVVFPEMPKISYDMQQLVRGLLRQKPEYRLGATDGIAELRSHRALRII